MRTMLQAMEELSREMLSEILQKTGHICVFVVSLMFECLLGKSRENFIFNFLNILHLMSIWNEGLC